MKDNEINNKFWDEIVYNSDPNNIYNSKINEIISNVSKLKKRLNSQTLFGINENFQLEVFNCKQIVKDIDKIKKDNIFYLKTHAESIPEYFKFIFDQNMNLSNEKNIQIPDPDIIFLYEKDFNNINLTNSSSSNISNIILLDRNQKSSSLKLSTSIGSGSSNQSNNSNQSNQKLNSNHKIKLTKLLKKFSSHIEFDEKNSINKNFNQLVISKIKIHFKSIYPALKTLIENNFHNKQIILLDSENILKSFKIQNILKNLIGHEKFNNYFDKWIYGDFNQIHKVDCSASLTEYSNSIKYTEPFCSIGLDLTQKKYLIDLFISKYLNDFFIIYFLNIKSDDLIIKSDDIVKENYILCNESSLFLPIIYQNKNEIREQDDYMLVFLYEFLNKKNFNSIIISGDKFKFYKKNIKLKNIFNLYETDKLKIFPIICNQSYTDIFKIINSSNESNYYQITKFFPLLDLEDLTFKKKQIDLTNSNEIIKYLSSKYFEYICNINREDIDIKNLISNHQYIKNLLIPLNNSIKIIFQLNTKFKIIFDFLEKNNKKDILNLILNKNSNEVEVKIKEILPNSLLDKFDSIINDYKKILNIYLIAKSFKFLYGSFEYIIKLAKLFSLIMYLYDSVDIHIIKIRKLGNKKSVFNIVFLHLNSTFIYLKKIGLCKKNH